MIQPSYASGNVPSSVPLNSTVVPYELVRRSLPGVTHSKLAILQNWTLDEKKTADTMMSGNCCIMALPLDQFHTRFKMSTLESALEFLKVLDPPRPDGHLTLPTGQ
jgi:hypothetical protein